MNLPKLFLSLFAAGCVLQAGMASAQDPAKQAENVQAQWQQSKLNFQLMGIRAAYNCDSIEAQLGKLLRDLGAKPDVRVSATGCAPSQISSTILARIQVSMPVAAGSATATDGPAFPAQRKAVTLTVDGNRHVSAGDCQFLEQVRDQLLPALKLQIVKDELNCYPGTEMLGSRTMQVAALVPAVAAK